MYDSRTDKAKKPNPFAKEDTHNRRAHNRRVRREHRDAMRKGNFDVLPTNLRVSTSGRLTW